MQLEPSLLETIYHFHNVVISTVAILAAKRKNCEIENCEAHNEYLWKLEPRNKSSRQWFPPPESFRGQSQPAHRQTEEGQNKPPKVTPKAFGFGYPVGMLERSITWLRNKALRNVAPYSRQNVTHIPRWIRHWPWQGDRQNRRNLFSRHPELLLTAKALKMTILVRVWHSDWVLTSPLIHYGK